MANPADSSGPPQLTPPAQRLEPGLEPARILRTIDRVRPYTMVSNDSLVELARQVYAALVLDLPGQFVECGVWRGGASFLMADLLRQAGVSDRKVWLFDSFEGLPEPELLDGPAALDYAQNRSSSQYRDNCRASLDEVKETASLLGLGSQTELVQGWFDQTLPASRPRIGSIALLRIDADWHASVRCCLEQLYDRVVEDGFVIFDDYFNYEGCAIAVHEFMGHHKIGYPIESPLGAARGMPAVFRKGRTTWHQTWAQIGWSQKLRLTWQELVTVIPSSDPFILVDQEELRGHLATGRRTMPFLEKDGSYWGPPADDETAIRECERLRNAGAKFIAFVWPAFWWLEYYVGFARHLRSRHRCVVQNERLLIFQLY